MKINVYSIENLGNNCARIQWLFPSASRSCFFPFFFVLVSHPHAPLLPFSLALISQSAVKRDSANGKRLPSSPLFSVCRERTAELTERNASATDAHHFSASRASRIRSAAHPDQDVRAKITQLNENKNASKRCVTAVTFTELTRKLSEHQQRSRRNTERHSCSF